MQRSASESMSTGTASAGSVPRVAIAGATGFVGSALRRRLSDRYRIRGLTRSPVREHTPVGDAGAPDGPGVEWRRCDLFRLREVTEALRGCDVALYLVHSMSPSARLTQAHFADLDLLMADTFRRGAEAAGVKQIVFLSGLVPDDEELSEHLASRLEVENALDAGPVPLTAIRAGLIVGAGGSSFEMMTNLVRRLPLMILPRWTRSTTQPIALHDVVRAFEVVLEDPAALVGRFDVGGPDRMTYREMMRRTGEATGRRIAMLDVRAFSPRLSVLWVSLFGGQPRALVAPLVESLRHDMVASDNPLQDRLAPGLVPFDTAVREALEETREDAADPAPPAEPSRGSTPRRNRVRSVQRFPLPVGRNAGWAAREYLRWLPRFARPFMRVRREARGVFAFTLGRAGPPLLELTLDREASRPDRRVYRITGGRLARAADRDGRMEFRSTPNGRSVLVAVHDYAPTLPWYVYNLTQANAHLTVMRGFGRHLRRAAGPRA